MPTAKQLVKTASGCATFSFADAAACAVADADANSTAIAAMHRSGASQCAAAAAVTTDSRTLLFRVPTSGCAPDLRSSTAEARADAASLKHADQPVKARCDVASLPTQLQRNLKIGLRSCSKRAKRCERKCIECTSLRNAPLSAAGAGLLMNYNDCVSACL